VTLAEAESLVLAGRMGGILVVPPGFERDVQLGRKARVGVFADASYFLVYRQVATGFLETVGTLSAGIDIRRLEARGRTEAAAWALRDPVPLLVRPLFNPTEGYASYVVPAVLVLILQQTLLIGIGLLGGTAAEKRGTGPAPASLGMTRLLGRALFYLALYSAYSVFVFAVVYRLYGFPERSRALDLSLFALPFLLACIFLALALGALFTRRETAMQVLLFTSLPSVFLAGFAWPVEAVPSWLRAASLLIPSTSGIAGFLRLTEMGAQLRHVGFEWLVLWALASAYFLLAWLAERRQGGPRSRSSGLSRLREDAGPLNPTGPSAPGNPATPPSTGRGSRPCRPGCCSTAARPDLRSPGRPASRGARTCRTSPARAAGSGSSRSFPGRSCPRCSSRR
jgi:ABC-2 type transport system permease protein